MSIYDILFSGKDEKMKILLTTLNSKFIHSSLALRYLYQVGIKHEQMKIDLKEYTINMHTDDILIDIYKGQFDLVVFSTYIWNYNETKALINDLKRVSPQVKILLGGPEVTFNPRKELKENTAIDYIIYGEGERTFDRLLETFSQNKPFDQVKGLAYRDEKNNIYVNTPQPLIKDLDWVPFPYAQGFEGLDHRIIYYESTRGCPFNCSYCLSSTIKGVRFFSLERVKKDLIIFLNEKVKQVKFVDRTFNIKKAHYFEIIKFLNEHDNGVTNFHFEVTASLLDDEVIDYLKSVRPGLFQMEVGIQTTNTKTLEAINRGMPFSEIKENLEKIVALENVHNHFDLIAGLPFEDFHSFMKSFDDVYSLESNKLQLGFLKVLKGSEMMQQSFEHGLVCEEKPPYQVLFNKYLSFDEMIIIRGIEELLDTYYNSHYFDYSLRYLIQTKYNSPHQFYQAFYNYWEANDLFNDKHSKQSKYKILMSFYALNFDDQETFNELLKYDYILNKNKKIDGLFKRLKPKGYRNMCHEFLQETDHLEKYLPHFKDKNAKYIIKRVHIERFRFDVQTFIQSGFKAKSSKNQDVLFDYSKSTINHRSLTYNIQLGKED